MSLLLDAAAGGSGMSAHWLIRYDPDDGEPYGEVCDCEIGDDHDETGEGE